MRESNNIIESQSHGIVSLNFRKLSNAYHIFNDMLASMLGVRVHSFSTFSAEFNQKQKKKTIPKNDIQLKETMKYCALW